MQSFSLAYYRNKVYERELSMSDKIELHVNTLIVKADYTESPIPEDCITSYKGLIVEAHLSQPYEGKDVVEVFRTNHKDYVFPIEKAYQADWDAVTAWTMAQPEGVCDWVMVSSSCDHFWQDINQHPEDETDW